ncbi:fibrous sheath-interacting protein 2-like [Lissotriton helveticus]
MAVKELSMADHVESVKMASPNFRDPKRKLSPAARGGIVQKKDGDIGEVEIVARNSFLNVLKPDITKVELLKDVRTHQELIVRLVAHDIDHHVNDEVMEDIVISTGPCVIEKDSQARVLMAKISSIAKKKKCFSCNCCGKGSTKTKNSGIPSPEEELSIYDSRVKKVICVTRNLQPSASDRVIADLPRGQNCNANSNTASGGRTWLECVSSSLAQKPVLAVGIFQNSNENSSITPFTKSGSPPTKSGTFYEDADTSELIISCFTSPIIYEIEGLLRWLATTGDHTQRAF